MDLIRKKLEKDLEELMQEEDEIIKNQNKENKKD